MDLYKPGIRGIKTQFFQCFKNQAPLVFYIFIPARENKFSSGGDLRNAILTNASGSVKMQWMFA
jgi:hypothetical protein